MRIHYLQHVPFEDPANIVSWSRQRGHSLTGTHLYNYEALPGLEQFDWLVIMGGPMNIYQEDEYPWLAAEKQFIKAAIDKKKAVLGICLGAQLIADVLGGKVTKNPQGEIGWLPVQFYGEALESPLFTGFPATVRVFQWHNDTFSTLGEGCVCFAGSEACGHQAFVYKDRVIGLQFHMECSEASIRSLLRHCADELTDGPYLQTEKQILDNMGCLKTVNALMDEFLDRLEQYYLKRE
ncbi:type 1 glutamine amidotransferase [Sporomusa aerivorans]|uniref:type 1 glutamine amidotransferase n=1 Tax=Sporomusa aerivorans TaxID=204936 RepID=UPI00352A988F